MKPHEAIRFARKRAKLTQDQVAERMGISRAAVAQWETAPPKGTMPEPDKWPDLARLFACTIDEVLRGPASSPRASNVEEVAPAKHRLPLLSWVSAGKKESAEELVNVEEWPEFDGPFSQNAFCLRVRGNSMTSADGSEPSFPDGCLIGVEPGRRPLSGEFAVYRFRDSDEAVFKRYVKDGPLEMLVALAPGYPVIVLKKGDAHLVGTVTEKRIITRY